MPGRVRRAGAGHGGGRGQGGPGGGARGLLPRYHEQPGVARDGGEDLSRSTSAESSIVRNHTEAFRVSCIATWPGGVGSPPNNALAHCRPRLGSTRRAIP